MDRDIRGDASSSSRSRGVNTKGRKEGMTGGKQRERKEWNTALLLFAVSSYLEISFERDGAEGEGEGRHVIFPRQLRALRFRSVRHFQRLLDSVPSRFPQSRIEKKGGLGRVGKGGGDQ